MKASVLRCAALLLFSSIGAQSATNALSIFAEPNRPAPHFRTSIATGARPTIATAIDINGDHLMDLVSANYYGNSITIQRNLGGFNFQLTQNVVVGGLPTLAIPLLLNRDSAMDIAVAISDTADSKLVTLTNDGAGFFTVSQRIQLPIAPVSVASGDLNGDGFADVVTANYGSQNLSVLTNDSQGVLELSQTIQTGNVPHGVLIDDVDHDGWRDIVINCFDGGLIQVFKNDGAGRFSLTQTVRIPDGGIPHWITGSDFNGDGFIDVATSNERSNTITVLTNDHHGNFAISANFPATISAYGIAAGDWDGDGRIDLAASSNDANQAASVLFRNAGDGRFEPSYLVGKNVSYVPTLTRLDQTENIYLILAELTGDKMDIFSMQRSSFRLEWPLDTGSWILQAAQTPEPGAWAISTVPIMPNPLKAANEVYLDESDAHRFFRLAQ